jgi:outer membrane protein assembly factor BamB
LLVKLKAAGSKIEPHTVWDTTLMDNHHGGVILLDGHLYGSGHKARGWFCLNFATGKQRWNAPGKGALTYADGMLYCLEENGETKLVRATPTKYEVAASFKVPRGGKGMFWAHPVVCGGRLYIRHADKLYAYAVE